MKNTNMNTILTKQANQLERINNTLNRGVITLSEALTSKIEVTKQTTENLRGDLLENYDNLTGDKVLSYELTIIELEGDLLTYEEGLLRDEMNSLLELLDKNIAHESQRFYIAWQFEQVATKLDANLELQYINRFNQNSVFYELDNYYYC